MKIAIAGGTGTVGNHLTGIARERGHEVVVLSRSTGADLVSAAGLPAALDGVAAVIDVTGVQTQSSAKSRAFFGAVTRNLLDAERDAGVAHHLALGIVGSDLAPFGYYAGKVAQEERVEAGPVPWTILRATQFHEFAAQVFGQYRFGPFVLIPSMRSQPVAAREVAERLLELAVGEPQGRVRDLAGPEQHRMIDMVERYVARTGSSGRLVQIPVPGGFGRALRDGTLLPVGCHDEGAQTFGEWLEALLPLLNRAGPPTAPADSAARRRCSTRQTAGTPRARSQAGSGRCTPVGR
ncbi:nucleoside-diphosphate sugar epimerase [Frondihabitans sucicola]|uniref:Nucleoside-diphosphate sugar epimerase n=1 Tax=Frondihabitans sucicola TaxID=1268041 RepID=A0ABM8GPS7_9MICO|nr:SDR family oxidoreductase [Frondihabitans sucicola]BDZ50267.1 nucleoside-diphosphate sugar epimerase [Frondihabitans sucicola]